MYTPSMIGDESFAETAYASLSKSKSYKVESRKETKNINSDGINRVILNFKKSVI